MRFFLITLFSILLIGCGGGSSSVGSNILVVDENGTTSINTQLLESQLQDTSSLELSEQEEEDLIVLREEEKLAHDVYISLYSTHGQNIFYNIGNSEQTHTEAVLTLINHYDLEDPVADNTMGVFTNQTLQTLYDDLVLEGGATLLDGYIVGATIEDLDIQDIEDMKSRTTNEDLLLVYESLQKGSRNHLRSFVRQIESFGYTYTPKYISQEMYDFIISSPMESGQ